MWHFPFLKNKVLDSHHYFKAASIVEDRKSKIWNLFKLSSDLQKVNIIYIWNSDSCRIFNNYQTITLKTSGISVLLKKYMVKIHSVKDLFVDLEKVLFCEDKDVFHFLEFIWGFSFVLFLFFVFVSLNGVN